MPKIIESDNHASSYGQQCWGSFFITFFTYFNAYFA